MYIPIIKIMYLINLFNLTGASKSPPETMQVLVPPKQRKRNIFVSNLFMRDAIVSKCRTQRVRVCLTVYPEMEAKSSL